MSNSNRDGNHHALVIGASGVIGWSFVNQLLTPYPSPSPFSRVTALVNRPLKVEDSFWPTSGGNEGGPTLDLISGVDLLCSDEEFKKVMSEVEGIQSISHVFYFAFKENPNPEEEVTINISMLRRVVSSIYSLSPSFTSLVYPGGTRGYGIYQPNGIFTAPLTEDIADKLPADYAKTVAYPHYRTLLQQESKQENAKWTWCELCPDAIIGFTPNGSGYSLAGHWAVYLYLWKLVHGTGAEVPFPGVQAGYDSKFTETSSRTLAKVAIYASTNGSQFQSSVVNVADTSKPSTMRDRWPEIAEWFGLKGVAPRDSIGSDEIVRPSEFIRQHAGLLERNGVKGVDIWNPGQLDSVGYWLTFDRQLSLEKLRGLRFAEETSPKEGWWEAFDMFKKAGMIK